LAYQTSIFWLTSRNWRRSSTLLRQGSPWQGLGLHVFHIRHNICRSLSRDRVRFWLTFPFDRASGLFAMRALYTLHAWNGHHRHPLLFADSGASGTLRISRCLSVGVFGRRTLLWSTLAWGWHATRRAEHTGHTHAATHLSHALPELFTPASFLVH